MFGKNVPEMHLFIKFLFLSKILACDLGFAGAVILGPLSTRRRLGYDVCTIVVLIFTYLFMLGYSMDVFRFRAGFIELFWGAWVWRAAEGRPL